jgi:regulatory protein
MKTHLEGKKKSEIIINETIARLKGNNYLNDYEFASQWIDSRNTFAPRGKYLLKQELNQKGVDEGIIATLLEQVEEFPLAIKAAEKKFGNSSLSGFELKKKIFAYLGNKGFGYDSALKAYEHLSADHQ